MIISISELITIIAATIIVARASAAARKIIFRIFLHHFILFYFWVTFCRKYHVFSSFIFDAFWFVAKFLFGKFQNSRCLHG